MKKVLLALAAFAMGLSVSAQEFVSTEPSNRNVILEEFTGINCGWCPDGHRMANELMANNPGRLWAINIHVGSYAANTYTTQWGNALMSEAQVSAFPTGWVNRNGAAQGRDQWSNTAAGMMSQVSPVNIAARCTIDYAANTMALAVEMYFTGEGTLTRNLNCAILQNNIIGPQGGSSMNPDQVEGSQYRHMHMLRDLLTGQWGLAVSFDEENRFQRFDTTFTIPAEYGTPNPVDVVKEDLDVVCFLAENHKPITTGCEAQMAIINGVPNIKSASAAIIGCDNSLETTVNVNNMGNEEITSMEITYTVNGTAHTYNWTGSIAAGSVEAVNIPATTDGVQPGANAITVQITNLNGETFSSNTKSFSVDANSLSAQRYLHLRVKTDQYGSEASWKFRKADGTILRQSPSYANQAKQYDYFLVVPEDGCYTFEYADSYGDGFMNNTQGVWLFEGDGDTELFSRKGSSIGAGFSVYCSISNHEENVGIDALGSTAVALYPNPATDQVTIAAEQIEEVKIINTLGQVVYTNNQVNGNELVINTTDLAAGLYIAQVRTAQGQSSQRFSVVK